ncbi:helix-turn-helix transcriptional regulator [Schleiferilactobacillus harbinensis]|uniref:Helix-turn-helix transcriptional regulator n=1 Tax=Schleiferilactobacillus harbinensis TaxID=304207 RepID=A0ABU7SWH2_9LACO
MLANRLSILLAERDMTIKELTTKTGLSRNTVSNLVNKPTGNISVKTTDLLCNYLKITPREFFEYSPVYLSFPNNVSSHGNIVARIDGLPRIFEYTITVDKNAPDERLSFYNADVSFDKFLTLRIGGKGNEDFQFMVYTRLSARFQKIVLERLEELVDAFISSEFKGTILSKQIKISCAIVMNESNAEQFLLNRTVGPA